MVEVEHGDGDFEGMMMCPEDHYITAGQLRYENYLGAGRAPGYDDTAINGFRFKCKSEDHSSEQILEFTGEYGQWKDWTVTEEGKFVAQARARNYDPTVGDNSGMEGLSLWVCPS